MSPPSSNAARRNESSVAFGTVVSSSGMSYTPIFELGEGGMGKVFLARAKGAGDFTKLVVLKAMRVGDLGNEPVAQMFANEARLSARFNHPNLVQVQEVNLSAVPPFLVMEYLDGKPLSALRSRPEVTLAMHLAILSEVLSGLHYAHELRDFDGSPLGIVHRDVSPHNVFITCDGAVKVLDFGIAKVNGVEGRTVAGEIKGKLGYMAPEQLLDGEVDRRADVFSIGSMLWEAAIGKRMWEGVPDPNLMHRLATFAIPRPSDHGRIDPELEAIILKATAGRASDRYSSAREFQQALDEYRARRSDQTSLRRVGALLAETFRSERLEREALISSALKNSLPPPPLGEAQRRNAGLEFPLEVGGTRRALVARWRRLLRRTRAPGTGRWRRAHLGSPRRRSAGTVERLRRHCRHSNRPDSRRRADEAHFDEETQECERECEAQCERECERDWREERARGRKREGEGHRKARSKTGEGNRRIL
jgi:serine/threonine protein kinase